MEKKMNKPRSGFCSPVNKINRVIDADTLEVEITRKFNIRLIHENEEGKYFNCPEENTQEGKVAKAFVEEITSGYTTPHGTVNPEITLFVPANNTDQLMDINSFNRILGEIWIGEQKLTDILLQQGYGELK